MTPEEKTQLIADLRERFVLIPRNRLWHFLGGAVTFAVAAFALSFAGVLAGMKSTSAVQAADRIERIRDEAEGHLKRLQQESAYVRYGSSVALRSSTDPKRVLHNHSEQGGLNMGGTVVNAQPVPASQSGAHWTLENVKLDQ
jgi:hypothetical protein